MEPTLEELRNIARGWVTARSQIIDARDKAAEASIFSTQQGTHTDFLKAKDAFDNMLAGVLTRTAWSPQEAEAFSELVSGWNSRYQAARASVRRG